MKKVFTLFKLGILEALEYRTEFFLATIGWSARLIISIFLFLAIFRINPAVAGLTLRDTIIYFFIIQILFSFVVTRAGFQTAEEIKNGDFSNYLLRPFSFFAWKITQDVSHNLVRGLLGVVIFALIGILIDPTVLQMFSPLSSLLGIISIFIAYILNFYIIQSLSLLSFWLISAQRFIFMAFAVISVFSGIAVPLELFPQIFQKILFVLPFPYLFYFPTRLFMNQIQLDIAINMFLWQILYAIIFYFIARIILHLGIQKYEAVGR